MIDLKDKTKAEIMKAFEDMEESEDLSYFFANFHQFEKMVNAVQRKVAVSEPAERVGPLVTGIALVHNAFKLFREEYAKKNNLKLK